MVLDSLVSLLPPLPLLLAGVFVILFLKDLFRILTSPTPTTDWPLVGSIPYVFLNWDHLYDWVSQKTEQFGGKPWSFSIPFNVTLMVITDPASCEHMLKTNFDNYEKGPIFRRNFHDFLGDGIFNVDGEKWKMQRKTASHMFSVSTFKNHMVECFVKHGEQLVELLEKEEGRGVDLNGLLMRYTLDSIGEIGFDCSIGSLHNPSHPFATSFDFIQNIANFRFFVPGWVQCLNPVEYVVPSHIRSLSTVTDECIQRHKRQEEDGEGKKADFLSMFMEQKGRKQTFYKDQPDSFYTDLIMNFTIAGRDTTGLALSWMFWLLATHPDKEEKVIEEIDRVIGSDPVTYDNVAELKYLEAVFSETLRLYPSVPKDGKMALADDILPDGTPVPAGTMLTYHPYAMGRREALWENAAEFTPERFIETPHPSPYKFIAFQAGPRTCLGQRMAYLEAKVVTAMLYQHFRFRVEDGFVPKYGINLTLSMKNGLRMVVEKREKK